MRAVTYARQSKQREDESQGSPEAQRQQTRALVDSRGWAFVDHFEDLGASGYNPKAPRPGLDAALELIASGGADVLVVYRLDRLTRRGVGEAIRIVEQLRADGASLVSAQEPFLDTSTAMGTGIFGLFAAMAQQESENISVRSAGAKRTLREAGSHAGGRAPFGFAAVREAKGNLTLRKLVPEPREADLVREVVARITEGDASVVGMARELNARGLRPRSGADWATSTLTKVLRSPQIAGFLPARRLEHEDGGTRNGAMPTDSRGRILIETASDGSPVQPWEPIISPHDWYRLQDVLDARPIVRGSTREASLLGGTGLLVCGRCGGGMGADRRPNGTGGNYRCMKHRRSGTCEGTTTSMTPTEDFIARAVFTRLSTLDPSGETDVDLLATVAERFNARTADGEADAERRGLQESVQNTRDALDRLDDDRAAGLFDGETGTARYRRQVRSLTERLDAATVALQGIPSPGLDITPWLDSLTVGDTGPIGPDSPWASWDIAERREFLKLALDRVEVLPTRERTRGGVDSFRGDLRLRLVWAKPGSLETSP